MPRLQFKAIERGGIGRFESCTVRFESRRIRLAAVCLTRGVLQVGGWLAAVSYTHLTLPTICSV
eukprot:12549554-Alexandrium_andersonii.AAC.1